VTYYYDEVVRMRRRAFYAGALAGGIVIAVIWATQWLLGSGGSEHAPAPEPAARPFFETVTVPPSRLESCQAVFDTQASLLDTLEPAVSHWTTQIAVMNKLVTRVITLHEALQFWDETRNPAGKALARYRSAHEAFDERTARCPRPEDGGASTDELRCSKAVDVRDAEIEAADAALTAWRENVDRLETLRKGQASRDDVTAEWLTSLGTSVKQLAAYRTAAHAADGLICPGATGVR
jgi:hypothetical protein